MKKVLKKILYFLPLVFIISFIFIIPRIIVIRKIVCSTQYDSCDRTIISEIEKNVNKKLPFAKKEISIYLDNNYFVRDYVIQYQIPDVLKINIVIEKAKYCLKSEINDIFFYIDKDGMVLELRDTCNLPTAYIVGRNFNVGEKIENEYLSALNLLNQIFISYNIKEGKIIDNYLEVQFSQGYKVLFPLNKDNQVLLGSLRLIINRLNSEETESRIIEGGVEVIDLRYENPVLR